MSHRILTCLLALICVFSATGPASAAPSPAVVTEPARATSAASSFEEALPPGAPDPASDPAAAAGLATLLVQATHVAVGSEHTCALTSGGGVKCWGSNYYGQLGNDTTINSPTPVDVTGLTSGVAAVAAGGYHTCVVMDAVHGGGVKCWGDNAYSQLGNNTVTRSPTPVDVSGLASGVAAVAAGGSHTCAVMDASHGGGVVCWGDNAAGQLGDGTTTGRYIPMDVTGLTSGVAAVAAGGYHTCALMDAGHGGAVVCWGRNVEGQLGDGTAANSLTPVGVSGLDGAVGHRAVAVATGNSHTCVLMALDDGGTVRCWGYNRDGQLGDGSKTDRVSPVDVTGLTSGVAAVAAGASHTCALMDAGHGGGVRCWGSNASGQLGDGTVTDSPTPVNGLDGVEDGAVAMAASGYHACALMDADHGGGVKCWGSNTSGQLGDGTTMNRTTPVSVGGLTSVAVAVAAGRDHTCRVTTNGAVECWGSNTYGQLGDGKTTSSYSPVGVTDLASGVTAVAAGWYHTCALTTGGAVKCWGRNTYGQLGNDTSANSTIPVNVSELAGGAVAVAAGGYHTCALMDAGHGGAVRCWGLNASGQLGNNTDANSLTPVDVSGLDGATAVTAGASHTCAVTSGRGVRCWGDNTYGQLGDDTISPSLVPVDVVDGDASGLLSDVAAVAAGGYHTCALKTNGAVKCWGSSSSGQLGDGTYPYLRMAPVNVIGLDGSEGHRAASVSAGGNHTCAVTTDGAVKCWGRNSEGQMGDGTTTIRYAPVDVREQDDQLLDGVAAVAAGARHTCAVKTNGAVKCWGSNAAGQLGVNPGWTPVDVWGLRGALVYNLTITPATPPEPGIVLRWQHGDPDITGITGYEVYSSTVPYFTPGAEKWVVPLPPNSEASYNDRGAFAEPPAPPKPLFYVVQAVVSADLSYPKSNCVGAFSFALAPGIAP